MKDTIGNFDIKIPIDVDSKSLEDVKKQVDSLEKKPQKISIQLDAKSYDKQLDNLLNQGNKHAKTIGKNFSAAIREGMEEGEINLSSLIKTGGAKVKPKDVRDFVDSITGIIDKDLSNFSGDYKDLVKYAEELEHVRNILVAIKNDATYGGAIKGGSKKNLDWIEGLIGKIDTKYTDDIGNILKGNKDIFAKQVQDMFDFAKERIKDLSRSLKDGLEFSAMGENIEEGIKEVFGRFVQGYATEIDKATKTIEDKTKELEKEKEKLKRALSVGDTASSAFFDKNKNLLQKIFEAELGKINSKEMQEKSEKEIKEFYKYIISLNNLYESKGLRTEKLTITGEDGTKVRGDKLVEQAYNSLSDTELSKIKELKTIQSPLIKEYFENQAKEIQAGVDKLENTIENLKSQLSGFYQQAIDEIAKKRDQLSQELKNKSTEEETSIDNEGKQESREKKPELKQDKQKSQEAEQIRKETEELSEAVKYEIDVITKRKEELEDVKKGLLEQKAKLGKEVRTLSKSISDVSLKDYTNIFDTFIASIDLNKLEEVSEEAKKYVLDLYETLKTRRTDGGVGGDADTVRKYKDAVDAVKGSLGQDYSGKILQGFDKGVIQSKQAELDELQNKINETMQLIEQAKAKIKELKTNGDTALQSSQGGSQTISVNIDTKKLVTDMQKTFDETTFQITITLSEASKTTLDAIKNAFKDIPVDIKQSEKEGGNTVTVTANGTALRTSIENILKDEKNTFDIDIIPKQGLRAKIVDEISKQEQPFDIFTNIASDVREQIKDKIGTDPFDISTKVLANIKEQISNLIGETIPINIKPIMPQKPERTNKTTITRERANGDTVTTESSQTTGGAATATSNIDNSFNRGTDNVNKYNTAVGSLLESLRKVGTEIDKIATKSSKVAKVDVVDEQEIDQVYRLGELLNENRFVTTKPGAQLKEAFEEFSKFLDNGEQLNNLSQAGTIAAYKYFKAFEEALKAKKPLAESTLRKYTIGEYVDGFTNQSELFKKNGNQLIISDKLKQNVEDFTYTLQNMKNIYDEILQKHGQVDFTSWFPKLQSGDNFEQFMQKYLGFYEQVKEVQAKMATGANGEAELQQAKKNIDARKKQLESIISAIDLHNNKSSMEDITSSIDQVKQHIESLNAESEPIITQQEKDQTIMALDEIIAKVESVGDSFGKGFNTEQMLASLNNMKTQVSNMDTSLIASDGSIQLPVNITFSFEKFYKELQDKLAQAEELKPKLTIDGIEQLEQLKTLINEELPKAVTDVVSKFSSISADIKTQADAFKNLSDQIKEANAQLTAFITNQNKKNFSLKEVKVKFENIAKAKQDLDKQLEKVNSSIAVKPIVDDKAFKNVQNKIDELKNQLHDFYNKVNPIQSIKLDEPAMQTILAKYQRYLQQFQETGDKNAFINALAQKPTKLNKINTFDVEELRKVARRIIPSDARQGADINKMTKSELARIIGESESQNLFLNEEFRQITTLLSTHIPNALKTMVEAFTKAEVEVVKIMGNIGNAISPIESALTAVSTQEFIDPDKLAEVFGKLNLTLQDDFVVKVVSNLQKIRNEFNEFLQMDLSKSNIFSTLDNILKKSNELDKMLEVLRKRAEIKKVAKETGTSTKYEPKNEITEYKYDVGNKRAEEAKGHRAQRDEDDDTSFYEKRHQAIREYIDDLIEQNKANENLLVSVRELKNEYGDLISAAVTFKEKADNGEYIRTNTVNVGYVYDENTNTGGVVANEVDQSKYEQYDKQLLSQYRSFVTEFINLQNQLVRATSNGQTMPTSMLDRLETVKEYVTNLKAQITQGLISGDFSRELEDQFNKINVKFDIGEALFKVKNKDALLDDYKKLVASAEEMNAKMASMPDKTLPKYEELRNQLHEIEAVFIEIMDKGGEPAELLSKALGESRVADMEELQKMNREGALNRINEQTRADNERVAEVQRQNAELSRIENQLLKEKEEAYKKVGSAIKDYVAWREQIIKGGGSVTPEEIEKREIGIYSMFASIYGEGNGDFDLESQYTKQLELANQNLDALQKQTEETRKQKEYYDELRSVVKEYVALEKDLQSGKLFGDNFETQAQNLATSISDIMAKIRSEGLFNEDMSKNALKSMEDLPQALERINFQQFVNDTEKSKKAIDDFYNAMLRLKDIQDQIDVGNLNGNSNSVVNRLKTAQNKAYEARSKITMIPDEAVPTMNAADALFNQYLGGSEPTGYIDRAADLYKNLIKYAEEYYGLVYKQDTGKSLTYNESKRLEYLDSLYQKAIANADALQNKLSGEDVSLPDDLMDAIAFAKQKPLMEQYEALGKTISKYGDVQGNENYVKWLDSVNARYNNIKTMIDSIDWFPDKDEEYKLINGIKAVEDEIQKLQKNAKNERKAMAPSFSTVSETAKETLNRQMDQWISQNTAAKGAIQQIREYQRQLMSVTDKGALEKVKAGFEKVKREAIAAGETGLTFGEKLQKSMGNLARYLLSFVSFYRIVGTIKQGVEVVREMDKAMTDLKKVIDASEISFENFRKSSYDIAREIGVTAQTIVSAASEWGKLGYNLEESTELAKSSAVYVNVGDVTPEVATSDLVSVLKAFNKEASESIGIVDVLNNISNKYAVSAAELGEILKKSSSALAISGDTMENIVAMGAAMQGIVQDSSVVGSTLKVVSMRLRGATADLKEAGEETDGMATSTAKLRGQIMAMTKNTSLGAFDIMRNPNEFLPMFEIIDGVAQRWQDMAQVDQAALLELMAGRLASSIQKYIFMYTFKCVDCLIASCHNNRETRL